MQQRPMKALWPFAWQMEANMLVEATWVVA